jgi:hypothetical protein
MSDTTALRARLEKVAKDFGAGTPVGDLLREAIAALAPPVVSQCEGTCNHYTSRCGAQFCTYEEMAAHNRECRAADRAAAAPAPDDTEAPAGCQILGGWGLSSRICERGTKGCEVQHGAAAPAPEGLDKLVLKWRAKFPAASWKSRDDYYAGQACGVLKCSDELEAALRARPALSDGNTFVYCDHVGSGELGGSVRGAGHDGPHVYSPGYDTHLGPVVLQRPALSEEALQLAERWECEAAQFEKRTDDDYSAHAMMLRYCAVQLSAGDDASREAAKRMSVRGPSPFPAMSDETLREMALQTTDKLNKYRHVEPDDLIVFARAVLARQQEQG